MSWYDTYWFGLKSVVVAAWPEVAADAITLDVSAERRDWINLLNSGQLVPPWVIVKLNIADADDWNPDWQCYQIVASVHYIAQNAAAAVQEPPTTITEYLANKTLLLRKAAFSSSSLGTVLTSAPMSINADDPITAVLLDAKLPFQSASVQITSIVVNTGQ